MTDQQNEWWTTAGATPPDQPGPPVSADPDATVVLPARQPSAPAIDTRPSAQHPPHTAPPAPQPLAAGPPPQYANPTHQYGAPVPQGAPSYGVPQFVQPAAATTRYRAPIGSTMMLVGSLMAIIGTFLPWVTFPGGSADGYEAYPIGDGFDAAVWNNPGGFVVFAMIIVIVSAIIVLAAGRRLATWIIALLAAGLGGVMTLAALGAVGSVVNQDFASDDLGVGLGILLCLVGAIIAGVGALVVAAKKA